MDFLFGIEKEAEIYCTSATIAMNQQSSVINPVINEVSQNMIEMGLESYDYAEVVKLICSWAESHVRDSGWDLCDEDGVSWFLGLICTAYVRSLRKSVCPFEKIFKSCFIAYFENK